MGWGARGGKQDTDRVGGRYRLVERLGTGGMSVVWRGYDEILGRQVAVKVLSPRLAGDDSFRDRLRQEALAAARLCHPHITGIFDFGESPLSTQLTVPFVVMELNDGESLGARLTRQGPLSWRDAIVVAAEVASALATAHARGIVHRDVTPANIMLTSAGAKVVDFGISALVGQRDAAPDGSLLGTPAYLAPERLGGGQVSPAADVYALGLLLYRALTARLPWPAETTTEALRAHLYADPEPLPLIPGMPAEAAGLCLRCLAKRPTDRPGAAEVARSLGALVGVQAIISPLDSAFTAWTPERTRQTEPIPVVVPAPLGVSLAASRRGSSAASCLGFRAVPGVAFVLGFFGLLHGTSPAALRLRAGLWLGTVLQLGAARPLGGGLFAGGHLGLRFACRRGPDLVGFARPVLGRPVWFAFSGHRLFSGRHRLQAAAVTVILLVAAGVSWSAAREPDEVGRAQAAAAGPGAGPVVPRPTDCKVRYQVRHDDGENFEALLTVLNTGERRLARWRLDFAYPGTQRLINLPKSAGQNGRRVLLRGPADRKLRPGRAVVITLRGAYRGTNPLPLVFRLNGHACDVEILGPTTITTSEVADNSDTASGVKSGTQRARHHKQPHKTQKSKAKPHPRTRPRTPEPPPETTPSTKSGGFTVAV
jgi:serine/threonine-protein kinase